MLLIAVGCAGPAAHRAQEKDERTDDFQTILRLPKPRAAQPSDSDLANQARESFWGVFYAGQYEALPGVTRLLTAAYLENPRDPEITLLLAHAHLWKVSERRRLPEPDPSITDHLLLAEQYFEEAYRLNPDDHRIMGWLASARLALGEIRRDSVLTREGYALLHEAIRRYPAFNLFTAGFVLSGQPADDERYQEALHHIRENIERCSGAGDDRLPPGLSVYERAERANPACGNTPKAPHNFEGFVLNFGGMLMKAGRPQEAIAVYERARFSPTFESWPYREELEQRILDAEEMSEIPEQRRTPEADAEIMLGSAYACTACHAR